MCGFVTAYTCRSWRPSSAVGRVSSYLVCSTSFLSVIIITNLVVDKVVGSALAMWPQGYMAIGRQVARLISHIIAFRIYYKRGTKSFRNQSLYIIKKPDCSEGLHAGFNIAG